MPAATTLPPAPVVEKRPVRRRATPRAKRSQPAEYDAVPHGLRLVLRTRPAVDMTDREFYDFCRLNDPWRIEKTARGDLIIMAPTGISMSGANFVLVALLAQWVETDRTGLGFDSNAEFKLPNGAFRSPDASWVRRERLAALTPDEWQRFAPVCPDFVVELRSRTDRLKQVKEKMAEYQANGARLGWLINPPRREVFIYRAGQAAPERLVDPATVSGEDVLPGFTLELARLWRALEQPKGSGKLEVGTRK